MKTMRKYLLGVLTVLMLTPALTCAMAFCPMQTAQAAGEQPCHEANDGDSLMLALDCMGVDLFQQDANNNIQPDLSMDSVDFVWTDLVTDYTFLASNVNAIRGPPDRADLPNTAPSLILTTQRFRI